MLYERILIAVDFSPDSLAALGSVKELARRLGSEVIVLHVSEKLKVIPGSDLAEEERSHQDRAEELERDKLEPDVKHKEDEASRRLFVLQMVQPGLAGLMDGSVSALAPVFAAAFGFRGSLVR